MHTRQVLLTLAMIVAIGGRTQIAQAQAPPPVSPQESIVVYRLDFAINELDDAKKINTRHYSMNLGIGPSNVGPEKELKIGTRIPIEADQGKFQYLDVGTTVQAQLREFKGSTSLEARVEITNFATPDQATKGGQPLLRQMIISGSTLVISDKPVIMGSVDDPNSKRQFQLEVTVTRLR
jgi:hypothetical protein